MLLLGPIIVLISLSFGRCFSLVVFPSFGQERHQHQLFMVTESAYLERPTIQSAQIKRDEPIQMVPLSCPPLLLLQSSAPVISKEECDSLIEYFDYLTSPTEHDYPHNNIDNLDATQIEHAKSLLDDVHNIVDTVTNCPKHDGETKLPRYVRYYPTVIDEDILSDPKSFSQVLLPDGVHVDTNNGKLFRHITAILYLTDSSSSDIFNFGGGTTFPLAMPWIGADDMNDNSSLLSSAKALLERNIQHTKADIDQSTNSDGRRLELACVNTFNRDREVDTFGYEHNTVGVRVVPQAGRLIMFHNVDDAGMPDPASFHGGEELIRIRTDQQSTQNVEMTKNILVFFKEIPLNSFTDQESFAECAAKARQWTTKTYFQ